MKKKKEKNAGTFPHDTSSSKCQIPTDGETKVPCTLRIESINENNASRSSTTLCCRRRDRIFSGAFLPAFTSPRNRLLATVVEDNPSLSLSLSTCISADYLRLCTSYTTRTSTIHTHRLCGDVGVDIST